MEQTTLKLVRLLAPGFLLMLLIEPLIGRLPEALSADNFPIEFVKFPTYVVVFVFIYAALGLRRVSNRPYAKQIDHNIKERLWEIGRPSVHPPANWTTGKAMQLFYGFIDSDESLKIKASNIRFNGALWTTAADARAISFILLIVSGIFWMFVGAELDIVAALLINAIVFVASFLVSQHLTNHHKRLGGEQITFIEMNLKKRLSEKLTEAGF